MGKTTLGNFPSRENTSKKFQGLLWHKQYGREYFKSFPILITIIFSFLSLSDSSKLGKIRNAEA
jgi:hypothetical protein